MVGNQDRSQTFAKTDAQLIATQPEARDDFEPVELQYWISFVQICAKFSRCLQQPYQCKMHKIPNESGRLDCSGSALSCIFVSSGCVAFDLRFAVWLCILPRRLLYFVHTCTGLGLHSLVAALHLLQLLLA